MTYPVSQKLLGFIKEAIGITFPMPEFPEKICYAMSRSITGPWEYKGILNELVGNSNTNHQAIIEFKDNWYFIYHNGGINPTGGSFRRSVCMERYDNARRNDEAYTNDDRRYLLEKRVLGRLKVTNNRVIPWRTTLSPYCFYHVFTYSSLRAPSLITTS